VLSVNVDIETISEELSADADADANASVKVRVMLRPWMNYSSSPAHEHKPHS
jgi:hypothetical protein